MLTVGLVVEGPHDLVMLEPIIEHQFKVSHNLTVRFRRLQPFPDAIGKLSAGGWARVVAWCASNRGSAIETYFEPLFASDPPCDVIIIHLDGDVLEHIQPHTTVAVPAGSVNSTDRVQVIHRALEEWLAVDSKSRVKIAFAVPVLQTEAWILGAEGSPANPEDIDAKSEFRKSWNYKSSGPLAAYYSRKVLAAKNNFTDIAGRCGSYTLFKDSVEALHIA